MTDEQLTTREDASVASMLQAALAAGQDPQALDKLYDLYTKMEERKAEKALAAALAAFQGECPAIGLNAQGAKARYADLPEIQRIIRDPLARHDLSYGWDNKRDGEAVVVTCVVSHKDGAVRTSTFTAAESGVRSREGKDVLTPVQITASALTYGKRYSLVQALGLIIGDTDDDGAGVEKIDEAQAEALCKTGEVMSPERWASFMEWASKQAGVKLETIADLPLARYQMVKRTLDEVVADIEAKKAEAMGKGAAQ